MMEGIDRLCRLVEESFGSEVKSPKAFNSIAGSIFERTGVLISATTLKRIWGYLSEPVTPRQTTLDVLARYIGWSNWIEFQQNEKPGIESGIVSSEHIDVLRQLKWGEVIRLLWPPSRVCDIKYIGAGKFQVIKAEGTKLSVGDTFTCHLIVDSEPLYLDNLIHNGTPSATYVCGRHHGIRFLRKP